MAGDETIHQLFSPLWDEVRREDAAWSREKPLLAHYTSLTSLEKILTGGEIWFSNPLFMNDLEEVRFGLSHGVRLIKSDKAIHAALKTDERRAAFSNGLDQARGDHEREHLFDTYVFCFSEVADRDNHDGLLSMWRGYGGNGLGAAIVFDTAKIPLIEGSPLILAKVHYGTERERLHWIEALSKRIAVIFESGAIPTDRLSAAAAAVYERIKLFALFTKHSGFSEEREWRLVYLSERDPEDRLRGMLGFFNGARGVEPKLKFKVGHISGVTPPGSTLESMVSAILLGPSVSSPLAQRSAERMLDLIGRRELKTRLFASTIPFRSL